MAGPMGRFQYIGDDGTVYKMRLDASNAGTFAATTAAGTEAPFPGPWRPRYLLVQGGGNNRERKIVVPDPAHALWTGTGGTVSLIDYLTNAPATWAIRGRVGEKRYDR